MLYKTAIMVKQMGIRRRMELVGASIRRSTS